MSKQGKPLDFKLFVGPIALLVALLVYVYYPTFQWMIDRWEARDSYYGHGFIVPFVTAYWIFRRWPKLKRLGIRKSLRKASFGLSFLGIGMALQIISSVLRIYFVSAFSLIFILIGAVDLLFGRRALRMTWYPISFLMMMIPLPLLVISQITLRMKFFVSEISAHMIMWTGIPALRQGSYIYTPNAVLLVGDPCSGLRSFLAFLCLGFVFAYESKMETWKRLVLIAAGLPLAVISNVLRVFFLSMVGEIYGMKYTAGFLHDASGVVVFIFAFVGFMIIKNKLELKHA